MELDAKDRHKQVTAAVFGVILIGLGVIFILQNMGMISAGDIGSWWPVLLIGFGVSQLIAPKDAGGVFGGAILTGMGVFFLLRNLGVVGWSLHDLWPVLLVLTGVSLVARSLTERRASRTASPDAEGGPR
jgi:hypothetical protein